MIAWIGRPALANAYYKLFCAAWAVQLLIAPTPATAEDEPADAKPARGSQLTPDIRDDESQLKLQKGNFVIVPIPISNPTIGAGLVAGGAYFYGQTGEQKKVQPASVTAAAGFYTDSESFGYGIVQQNYWRENRWRSTAVIGGAELNLSLRADDGAGSSQKLTWFIDGKFAYAKIARQFAGKWYAGILGRHVDVTQAIGGLTPQSSLDTDPDVRSTGIGMSLEFDSRDMPINTFSGGHFNADFLFNDENLGSDNTYQSYSMSYSSYHELSSKWVLAWKVRGCVKDGAVPIWDACRFDLRGFPVTDYLGKEALSGQIEARWRLSKRWGFVGFGGAGLMSRTLVELDNRDPVPSYGIGIRFMVLPAKRINLRVDYARSTDDDAIHVAVGEAF